jgi:hypothetical protein
MKVVQSMPIRGTKSRVEVRRERVAKLSDASMSQKSLNAALTLAGRCDGGTPRHPSLRAPAPLRARPELLSAPGVAADGVQPCVCVCVRFPRPRYRGRQGPKRETSRGRNCRPRCGRRLQRQTHGPPRVGRQQRPKRSLARRYDRRSVPWCLSAIGCVFCAAPTATHTPQPHSHAYNIYICI